MSELTTEQSSREQEIKACPFCGHVGLSFAEGSTFRWLAYSCNGCGISNEVRVQTLGEGTKEEWLANARAEAIKEWNARSPLPPTAITAEEAGREGDGWISVDDRKPEKFVEVLIAFRDTPLAATGQYTASDRDIWGWSFPAENDPDDTGPVTHWQPLPPAPAQSGGQG